VGPFFAFGLEYDGDARLVPPGTPGAIRLHGRVLDGEDRGIPDAVVEVWQPDVHGRVLQQPGSLRRDGHTFTGWGRCGTDRTGTYSFTTLAPGTSADAGGPPYFALVVFARGLLDRLFTRAYLPGHGADERDPLLASLEAARRATLVAAADDQGFGFDIRLQGEHETVFLAHTRTPD
jgi:protocatechuate 3,4-dioxygenase alpha subunit